MYLFFNYSMDRLLIHGICQYMNLTSQSKYSCMVHFQRLKEYRMVFRHPCTSDVDPGLPDPARLLTNQITCFTVVI
jgi:hypothetical protein